MTDTKQTVIVGVFEDRKVVAKVFDALLKAGFPEEQLGFVARTHEEHIEQAQQHVKHGHGPNALTRGIVGGLIGAADILLVPFIGPSDASNIFATALPITEEAMDRLPYPGSKRDEDTYQHPDDALRMTSSDTSGTEEAMALTSTSAVQAAEQKHMDHEGRTSTVAGGVVGGALGAAAAALLLPGIGPVVAGGIIAVALGGGAVGSVAGSFLGILTDIGVPHEEAKHYARAVKAGRTIVTIKDTVRQQEASDILRQYGATDIQMH